jgi:hypothetical protein
MFKKLGLLVAAAFIVILVLASRQPDKFRIERTLSIDAPPARIFPEINDLRRMDVWSPWSKLDPKIKQSFLGPSQGKGAISAWEGNKDVGTGSMEIIESVPNKSVKMRLDFLKPMKAQHTAEFILAPKGKATDVTWAMYGESPFLSRVMCVFMNMDKMVGSRFEQGLASLKAIAEKKG